MFYLTDRQTEKMMLWLRIKPWLIAIAFLLIAFENVTGVRTFLGLLPGYIALVVVLVIGLIMKDYLRSGKMWLPIAHISFLIDSSVLVGGIYFHGGLETPWIFGPAFVTFMGAYVFGTIIGIIYAAYTSLLFLSVFLLEYFRLVPHFPIYGLSDLYWIDTGYFAGSLGGIFLLNFLMAFAVGLLSRLTDRRNQKIEETLIALKKEDSRLRQIQVEAEMSARMVVEKIEEIKRDQSFIEDRKKEIGELQKEIEGLRGRGRK